VVVVVVMVVKMLEVMEALEAVQLAQVQHLVVEQGLLVKVIMEAITILLHLMRQVEVAVQVR